MGASIAWHLARRGVRVTLLERSVVAAGASGRTGALLRRHYSNRPEATLAHASHEVFRNWGEVVGGSCGFVETGLVVTVPRDAHERENLDRLRRNVALGREVGIETRVITPEELKEIEPGARVDDLAGAAYEPSTGCVDAVAATRGMAEAAVAAGATVVEGCQALTLNLDGNRISGVQTSQGRIDAGAVICAAGPWSPPLLATAGVAVPIEALRVQVVVLGRPLAMERPHRAYVDVAAGMFCRPFGPGRTLVGVSGGDQHDPVDPDRSDPTNDPDYPATAIAAIARRFPPMADAAYLSGHAGLYDMTPDAHPILGPAGASGPDNLYLAIGFSGAGFKKGPAVGQCLAEFLLDGRSSLLNLHPFRLDRFADDSWRTPWSDTEYILASDFGHKF